MILNKHRFLKYIYTCILIILVFSCSSTKELLTNKLRLDALIINGVKVSFDNRKDYFVYDVGLTDTKVRIELSVINYNDDVFFSISKDGNTVGNGYQSIITDKISEFVVKIQNIKEEKQDFKIYITKGKLPSLFIENNLLLESDSVAGKLSETRQIELDNDDYPGITFSGSVGDDFFTNGKAKIVDIEEIESNTYDTFLSLKKEQTKPTVVTLKKKSATELEFSIDGEYGSGVKNLKGFIDIEFDPTAFVGGGNKDNLLILYNNTYFFRYSFGDSVLKFDSTVFTAPSGQQTTSTKINFVLHGAKFDKSRTFFKGDDTFSVVNIPYDYEASLTVNSDLVSGHLELKRKYLLLKKGYHVFSIEFSNKIFKDIDDIDRIAGGVQKFYVKVE